ncbi:hypothetical protein [Pseudomonas laurylsulfatiphila]|uniref:hypothetical protein n=1 Tax=Pseudomonas laurylsulfatiphila TaxID=2011015 RepID=UPI003D1D3832
MPTIQLTTEADLLQRFVVHGEFYEWDPATGKHKYRRSLEVRDIAHNIEGISLPDAVFVMINPGKSVPIDPAIEGLTPTVPDKTQYQIMRVMESKSWKFVRVLNLSDHREVDKDVFLRLIPALPAKHSIFDISRVAELGPLINTAGPVIAAWGIDPDLDSLIAKAMGSLTGLGKSVVGRNANRGQRRNLYYHPLYQQTTWLECILNQL